MESEYSSSYFELLYHLVRGMPFKIWTVFFRFLWIRYSSVAVLPIVQTHNIFWNPTMTPSLKLLAIFCILSVKCPVFRHSIIQMSKLFLIEQCKQWTCPVFRFRSWTCPIAEWSDNQVVSEYQTKQMIQGICKADDLNSGLSIYALVPWLTTCKWQIKL